MSSKYQDAQEIANELIHDLAGRKGLGNEWEMIDPEIQNEIRDEWTSVIVKYL